MTPDRVIGRDGDLPWRLPDDLKRFKRITMGASLLMGRRNYESIGRPLPGRRNVVLTRRHDYHAPGCELARSLDESLQLTRDDPDLFVIGGASLYEQAWPLVRRLYLTRVHADVPGDVRFPDVSWNDWTLIEKEDHPADDRHAHPMTFEIHERPD